MNDDLRPLLEDLAADEVPIGDREDIVRRVSRRRRRRLVGAGVVALGIAALGIGLSLSTLRFDRTEPGATPASLSTSPDVHPGTVPKLDLVWSAKVDDAAISAGLLVDGGTIYVPTSTGLIAYPVDCTTPCMPLWRASVGSAIGGPSVAAANGVVAIVDPAKGLFVYDARCATDGSECQPRWSALPGPGEHLSSPSIDKGIVRVTGGTGDAPGQVVRVLGYPIDCSGVCVPAWTADEGTGTIHGEVTDLDGVGYQQVGMTVFGFTSDCRNDGGICPPDFRIDSTGTPNDQSSSLYGPVGSSDEIAFASGDGNVYGYSPHCGTSCSPNWVGAATDFLESSPMLQGDVVYVAASGATTRIIGFPLHCQGKCSPVMRADIDTASIEVADDEGLVAASHFGPQHGVFVFPTDCGDPCTPAWETSAAGDISGVAADASSIVLGSNESIVLYPRQCSNGCEPAQRLPVGGEAWWLFQDGGRFIVGARSEGVMSTSLTVSVFQIG